MTKPTNRDDHRTTKALLRSFITVLLLVAASTPPAVAQETDGQISGVVLDAAGHPLANQCVELRRPASAVSGRLVAVTDADGQFVYLGLGPGRYEVELREQNRVIATSGRIELSEGNTQVSGVIVALPAPPLAPPPNRRRVSANQLLNGQPVTDSFDALQGILAPGVEVP